MVQMSCLWKVSFNRKKKIMTDLELLIYSLATQGLSNIEIGNKINMRREVVRKHKANALRYINKIRRENKVEELPWNLYIL